MSGSKRNTAVVLRDYSHAPEDCARALAFLLRSPVSKEAARPGDPDDDAKESHGCIATDDYTS